MALTQPLDLYANLVQTFAGSEAIFIVVMLVIIASLAAKFKMSGVTYGLVILLFATLMASMAPWLYAIIVLVGGLGIYFTIIKPFRN